MHESEWLTRKKRIDSKLTSLNPPWKIIPYQEGIDISGLGRVAIEEFPTESGPADYALVGGGRLVGFIEAKKVSVSPQRTGTGEAICPDHFRRYRELGWLSSSFIYATNGEIIWFADVRTGMCTDRKISAFHTADSLQEKMVTDHRSAHDWLSNNPSAQINRLRYYQRDAIASIENGMGKGRREMLIAMATGTGKTFFTVAQIYRLLESKRARRILFLVDRKALAAQAVREFSSFNTIHGRKFDQEYEIYSQRFRREDFGEDEPFNPKTLPTEYLTNPNNTHTFVYVSTIQRMAMNLFGHEPR